jgi:3-carboxy-cis,cis-muconate cycloisomerase
MAEYGLLRLGVSRVAFRAGDGRVVAAMLQAERAWSRVLAARTGRSSTAVEEAIGSIDVRSAVKEIADEAEQSAQPVIATLKRIRAAVAQADHDLVHRGLTSQDVLDTALMLTSAKALDQALGDLARCVRAAARLADRHRGSAMVGRTLTQHAVPTTFGALAAGWTTQLLDAREALRSVRSGLPVQYGGAAGTSAAVTELGLGPAHDLAAEWASELGLVVPVATWQVTRTPVLRIGSACAEVVAGCGHVAGDVLVRTRPEIGEVFEPAAEGRGGSSAMPNKRNPVLSVAIRRFAITAPAQLGTLYTAAGLSFDQRSAGEWQAEWQPWRALLEAAATAAGLTAELLEGLVVDPARMRATLDTAMPEVLAERASIRGESVADQRDPLNYLGEVDALIDRVVLRVDRYTQKKDR